MTTAQRGTASTPTQLVTITKYSFLNYVRARRFLTMAIIVVLVNVALTLAVAYTQSQTQRDELNHQQRDDDSGCIDVQRLASRHQRQ